jgi:ABC-type branched-subunit amino acid transport system substrate-binding protein
LAAAMPRYQLSQDDRDGLIAYLDQLGTGSAPGVTDTGIQIGLLLPPDGGPLAELGQVVKSTTAAYLDEINRQGGIYQRKLELRTLESTESASVTPRRLERQLEQEPVLAMVNAFIAGAELEITALMAKVKTPLLAPLTVRTQLEPPLNPYVFYLFPGLREQGEALVKFAKRRLQPRNPRIAVVLPEDDPLLDIAKAIQEQCENFAWASVEIITYPLGRLTVDPLAGALGEEENLMFFLGPSKEISALMQTARQLKKPPTGLFFLGPLIDQEIFAFPPAFKNRIFVAFPTLPSDPSPAGIKEFQAFAARHQLPARHLSIQLAAYSGMKILIEGIKRAGRDVNREKLVRVLERLSKFDTGLTRPVSYSQNRRIGVDEPSIVAVNLEEKQLVPLAD